MVSLFASFLSTFLLMVLSSKAFGRGSRLHSTPRASILPSTKPLNLSSVRRTHHRINRTLTTTSHGTYLFIAGLGGTGHHYYQQALTQCPYCEDVSDVRMSLSDWWFRSDGSAYKSKVANLLPRRRKKGYLLCMNTLNGKATGMLSYPNKAHRTKYPRVDSLAMLAEKAEVSLLTLVLLRDTASLYASLEKRFSNVFNKTWGDADPLHPIAAAMLVQAQVLRKQLERLDSHQFACMKYEDTRNSSYVVDKFIHANLNTTKSFSFSAHATRNFYRKAPIKLSIPDYLMPFHRANKELIDYCFNYSAFSTIHV